MSRTLHLDFIMKLLLVKNVTGVESGLKRKLRTFLSGLE